MYPQDFDGILAGSPAFDANELTSWGAYLNKVTGLNTADSGFVTFDKWLLVSTEIMKQCDGLDGAMNTWVYSIHQTLEQSATNSLRYTAWSRIQTDAGIISILSFARKTEQAVLIRNKYHGLADYLITSDNSEWYYQMAQSTMGSLDSFCRYFHISGMGHCRGDGTWEIGILAHLSRNGTRRIMYFWGLWTGLRRECASHGYQDEDVNDTASAGVPLVRNHCKFPGSNKCVGPGPSTDPNAWKCV